MTKIISEDVIVQGSLVVEKTLTAKRDIDAQGKADVAKTLRVGGYADVANIRGAGKGVFTSMDTLIASYPRPVPGWWAIITDSAADTSGTLIVCQTDDYNRPVWINTGNAVNITAYPTEALDDISSDVEELKDTLEGYKEKAVAAVKTLQSNVSDLQETLGTNATNITTLQSDVGNNTSKITSLLTTVNNITGSYIPQLTSALDELKETAGTNATNITTLQSDVGNNTSKITSLLTTVNNITGSYIPQLTSALDELKESIADGSATNGTMRFDTIQSLEETGGILKEETAPDNYDGIAWLTDKKIFAAYVGSAVIVGTELVPVFTFYTLWDTVDKYMSSPGEEAGLWQDKAYIYGGGVYVWVRCDKVLNRVGGTSEYSLITEEEIDELLDSFTLIDGDAITEALNLEEITADEIDEMFDNTDAGDGTGSSTSTAGGDAITEINTADTDTLNLTAERTGNTVKISGSVNADGLDEISAEDIDQLF
ncbi:MAG: apolipoprotein A1/A4/E family protein [Prevotella sp.]|nr:apolipoprotein A1/A4/E family protein [Prevotella sp.]